jgi:hypothetical protein|tara:strand:+ start:193 stop:591 length:399 start_codon:yes stop_codon:yes gene_type:complete
MACTCNSSSCRCENPKNVDVSAATQLNICCRRANTFILKANVKDSNGTAIDLTAYTYEMQVRQYDNGPIVIPNSSITIAGTDAGLLTITITDANMTVDAGTYVYGVEFTLTATSEKETWFFGTFTVQQNIVN